MESIRKIMKHISVSLYIIALALLTSCSTEQEEWIRINQLGYRSDDIKVAVFISRNNVNLRSFKIVEVSSGQEVMSENDIIRSNPLAPFNSCYRLPFTELRKNGTYRIVAGKAVSPDFRIADDIYDGTADFLLEYMRQQRCGYNPFLQDSCHTNDGYIIYGEKGDSSHIDVTGGWHDAADYLQYVTTSANATYQLLFAYSENPGSFTDKYLPNGLPGSDGLSDVLNESMWGLEWLIKMNPGPGVMYNQIADDRDHIGFRFPNSDTANYGKGRERPVYHCTGEPQGLFRYKNRTTGIASTAGKFASAFAKGAEVFRKIDPEFARILLNKAKEAFEYGINNPGSCQTAPGTAPYFYEEDNWVDDMELAAIELYNQTGESGYLNRAIEFGRKEPLTPWIGKDTARHYQWYPFVNLGHPAIARHQLTQDRNEFADNMKLGLELTELKANSNPFYVGIPFIWCSNNLISAIVTQAHLYSQISGDKSFEEMEAAHRDWLFGCNPWGTSMIVGLPESGDYPDNTHSSYVVKGYQVFGGLVDGPVYKTIFDSHKKYISISADDKYEPFQTEMAVYHDVFGDYTSNECTMDGTASLVYYLASLESKPDKMTQNTIIDKGGVVRMDTTKREIYLCFTAHDFNDGFNAIISVLKDHNIKASFFLTGDFCRAADNEKIISRLRTDGHYIGPHSDKHLLYCSWENRDSLLVTREPFLSDIDNNFKALESKGIRRRDATIFLPPYEWYNDSISAWSNRSELKLVSNSTGTSTNQDWTFPDKGKPYYSSEVLLNKLVSFEKERGMNGYILLIHPGTDPRRKDKFYLHLDSVLTYLENEQYSFNSFSGMK